MEREEKIRLDRQDLDEAAALFKVLADPNRLRILNVLLASDSCNCELNDRLGLPPNLLSHHLRILRKAGLITSRRDVIDGRWIYYSVNKEVIHHWQGWFGQFFDPTRTRQRCLCGPEGELMAGTAPTGLSPAAEEER